MAFQTNSTNSYTQLVKTMATGFFLLFLLSSHYSFLNSYRRKCILSLTLTLFFDISKYFTAHTHGGHTKKSKSVFFIVFIVCYKFFLRSLIKCIHLHNHFIRHNERFAICGSSKVVALIPEKENKNKLKALQFEYFHMLSINTRIPAIHTDIGWVQS